MGREGHGKVVEQENRAGGECKVPNWAREAGVRWDGWSALASVRLEDSGRVDEDGKPVLKRVDLMEEFFENIHRQVRTM